MCKAAVITCKIDDSAWRSRSAGRGAAGTARHVTRQHPEGDLVSDGFYIGHSALVRAAVLVPVPDDVPHRLDLQHPYDRARRGDVRRLAGGRGSTHPKGKRKDQRMGILSVACLLSRRDQRFPRRAEGRLVWVPGHNRHGGRKGPHRTGAVFISDAGWFIPGGLDPAYEESASAAADRRTSAGSAGESRLLDLKGGWILSIPNRLMNVLLLWTLCVVALALPVPSADWRLILGIACMVGLLAYGLYAVAAQDTAARGEPGSSQGAVG